MPTLEGTIEDITFRNEANGWTVLRLAAQRERHTVVGVLPFVNAGERVRMDGEWTEHPEYGRQFKAATVESVRPKTKTGVERYLASGLIRGVGPATAKQIVQHFGVNALDVLQNEPERLAEIDGIGPKRAAMIAESFAAQIATRQTMLFLQSYDISPALSMRIYKRFGEGTQEVLRTNPYRLVDEVPGVGFRTADHIASAIGIPSDSEYRVRSGIGYILNDASLSAGHMYLPRQALEESAQRLLDVGEEVVDRQIRAMLIAGALVECEFEDCAAIYLTALYEAEKDVAQRLRALVSSPEAAFEDAEARLRKYERSMNVELGREQRDAVLTAVSCGLTVVTGGPGTGKTTSIRMMIELMSRVGEVLLAAPTGRAAKRMSEATDCPAKTIHRLLEYAGEDGRFQRDADNPLDATMIIIDETSMVDIFLMRSLLRAIRPGTRLVLVGDADQLPSVGAGNVLRDVIDSGVVPVSRLTEIFRQAGASMIVQNAHRINHGSPPVMNGAGTDFFIERKGSVADTLTAVLQLVSARLPAYMKLDPMRDIQVVTPMKKGEVGVWNLNKLLQQRLNPPSEEKPEYTRGDTLFREGDKVMQTRNDYHLEWKRGDEAGTGVFNGDMGFVTKIDREESNVVVTFDDERVAEYTEEALEELELAYCVSVHKSQGSEFPAVVLPLFSGPPMLLTRNLLYTAITRARKLVVIVGREDCVRRMVANDHIAARYSALNLRLIEAAREG